MTVPTRLDAALAGRYAIEREAGAGGMATVYLARDLRHERRVALKVLHPDLAAALGAERFLAEIRTTAALQHPHILPLHDSGDAGGALFYVMPFVEGETLRARLEREGPLPIDEALRLAREVLAALDYAHRKGIVHRDVKPENILLHDGSALVADFGIALAVQSAGGARMTQTGLSLGTPSYMSPEQAMGDRNVDARADVYAAGAVLYELLTGEPPFAGASVQAIVARVLTERPTPPSTLRDTVPADVEAAVLRALAKLPADRFATAHAFAEALGRSGSVAMTSAGARPASGAPRARWRAGLALAGAALAGATLAGVATYAGFRARSGQRPEPVMRFQVAAPPEVSVVERGTSVAISPDGRRVVFSGVSKAGLLQLYLRSLDQLAARPIPDTEGAIQPIFSPDGHALAFIANGKLRRVSLDGGPPATVASLGIPNGAYWMRGGDIVAGAGGTATGLLRVPAAGGEPRALTHADTGSGPARHVWPVGLEDGETIVFAVWDGKSLQGSHLAVTSLGDGRVTPLGLAGIAPLGVTAGQLVFVRADGAIMAAPFDGRRRVGDAVPVPGVVRVCHGCNGDAAVQLSRSGSLVSLQGASTGRLVLVDRRGVERAVDDAPRAYSELSLSPDGRRVAVTIESHDGDAKTIDVWIHDIATRTQTKLTSVGQARGPRWTPDGRGIIYSDGGSRGIWRQVADGSRPAERIAAARGIAFHGSIGPDHRSLVFVDFHNNKTTLDTVTLGAAGRPAEFVSDPGGDPWAPTFSPDGRWVAYASQTSGREEVFVAPFPGPGGRVQVSTNGGSLPRWGAGGRRLVYFAGTDLEMATVATSPTFAVISRAPYFAPGVPPRAVSSYDVSADGERMLQLRPSTDALQVLVEANWAQELRARTTGRR